MSFVQLVASDRPLRQFSGTTSRLRHPEIKGWHWFYRLLILAGLGAIAVVPLPAQAHPLAYCQQTPEAIAQKETLRQVAAQGNRNAQQRYNALL